MFVNVKYQVCNQYNYQVDHVEIHWKMSWKLPKDCKWSSQTKRTDIGFQFFPFPHVRSVVNVSWISFCNGGHGTESKLSIMITPDSQHLTVLLSKKASAMRILYDPSTIQNSDHSNLKSVVTSTLQPEIVAWQFQKVHGNTPSLTSHMHSDDHSGLKSLERNMISQILTRIHDQKLTDEIHGAVFLFLFGFRQMVQGNHEWSEYCQTNQGRKSEQWAAS